MSTKITRKSLTALMIATAAAAATIPSAQPAAAEAGARFRGVNAIAGANTADVLVGDTVVAAGVGFGTASEWLPFAASKPCPRWRGPRDYLGPKRLRISPTCPVVSGIGTFTQVAVGSEGISLASFWTLQQATRPAAGKANVQYFNGLPDVGVMFVPRITECGNECWTRVEAMSAGLVTPTPSGTPTIEVRGLDSNAVLASFPASLAAGGVYSVFLMRDGRGALKATVVRDAQFTVGPSPLRLPLIERLISGW